MVVLRSAGGKNAGHEKLLEGLSQILCKHSQAVRIERDIFMAAAVSMPPHRLQDNPGCVVCQGLVVGSRLQASYAKRDA